MLELEVRIKRPISKAQTPIDIAIEKTGNGNGVI
jgi:hypothetical protein